MYTPHFFSKIQMLLGPNLAHLLSAQDQGVPDSISTLATWPLSTKANGHGLMSLTSTSLLANHVHFTSCREMKSGSLLFSLSQGDQMMLVCWRDNTSNPPKCPNSQQPRQRQGTSAE